MLEYCFSSPRLTQRMLENPEEPEVDPELVVNFDDDATGFPAVASSDSLESSDVGLLPNKLLEEPPKLADGIFTPPKLKVPALEPAPPKAGNRVELPAPLLPKIFEGPPAEPENVLDLPKDDVAPKPLPGPNGVDGFSGPDVLVEPNGEEVLEAAPNGDGFGRSADVPDEEDFVSEPEEPDTVELFLSPEATEELKVKRDGDDDEGMAEKLGLKPPVAGPVAVEADEPEVEDGAPKPANALGGVGMERLVDIWAGMEDVFELGEDGEDMPFLNVAPSDS
ncbi:hypothetical protein ACEPAH_6629 [Sanghuangporus vaninii]